MNNSDLIILRGLLQALENEVFAKEFFNQKRISTKKIKERTSVIRSFVDQLYKNEGASK